MRRYLPWLFLIAAVLGLVGSLSAKHVNLFYAASRFTHVLISITYLLPHHRHW